jgi:Uma2 family endonuclease
MLAEMLDWETFRGERLRPLRRSEYERMVADGIFEDERIELLRGLLVEMSPQGTSHGWIVGKLHELLLLQLSELGALSSFEVRGQSSYAALEDSEPQPDVMVIRRQRFGEPLPDRAHLLVEVSVSSLRKDRAIKASIYAENGVPEYWIVDVEGGAVEVYTEPRDGAYRTMVRRVRGETLYPLEPPNVSIVVSEILPHH